MFPVLGGDRIGHGPRAGILLILFFLLPTATAAEVYKWVDDQGDVHYGDAPPRDGTAETLRTPPPPSEDAVSRARERLDDLRDRAAAQDREREKRRKHDQETARMHQERRQRCRQAQEALKTMDFRAPLYYRDDEGNRVFLDKDERAARRKKANKAIKAFCR